MQAFKVTQAQFLVAVLVVLSFLVGAQTVRAEGSFFLFPESGVYKINDVFEVEVRVDTGGESINAAEGRIEFNEKELAVISITTSDSIFNSWFPAPTFSNDNGVINFGGSASDGYAGNGGNVLTIEFEALANTQSEVNFQSGAAILAANGLGTNILTEMVAGVYTMTSKEVVPVIEYVAADNTSEPTNITSPTHPTEEGWYATSTATFTWTLDETVTGVRMLADEFPDTIPTLYQPEPLTTRSVTDMEEGQWYFHIQAQNENGWGSVEHRAFNVDVSKPDNLTLERIAREDGTDPGVSFFLTATDTFSGISHYEIGLDNGSEKRWEDDGDGVYTLNAVSPGDHTLLVRVFDRAGNYLVETLEFTVDSLLPPTFSEVPATLTSGTILVAKGISQPNSQVSVWVQRDAGPISSATLQTDSEGAFAFVHEETVEDGIYKIWAQVTDARGAKSELTEKRSIAVQAPGLVQFGERAVDAMSIIVPLAGLTALLIVIVVFTLSRVRRYRKGVVRETDEAQEILHKTFDALREQVRDELRVLDTAKNKRTLTQEESLLHARFKEMFDIAEETVGKEIHDIKVASAPRRIKVETVD